MRQHARHAIHALIELPVGGCALAPTEQVDDCNLVRQPANRVVKKEAEIASTVRVGVVHHFSSISPALEAQGSASIRQSFRIRMLQVKDISKTFEGARGGAPLSGPALGSSTW